MGEIPAYSSLKISRTLDLDRQRYLIENPTGSYALYAKELPVAIDGFNREEILANTTLYKSLGHKGVVPFYGIADNNGKLCTLTKYLDSVTDFLSLDIIHRFMVIYCLASSFQYLQSKGILPKHIIDLKKILFDSEKKPFISGFFFDDQRTFNYEASFTLPPEAESAGTYCFKTLSYVFGSLAYILIKDCQIPPADDCPTFPSNCPDKLKELINNCRNKDVIGRPTIDEIVSTLDDDSVCFPEVDKFQYNQYRESLKVKETEC